MDKNKKKLEKVFQTFICDTFFMPMIGAEIEFYLPDTHLDSITQRCKDAGINFLDIQAETGKNQWEISILHKNNPVFIADEIIKIRELFKEADFTAKPFPDDYGNSLHIHISLLDSSGKNIFIKNKDEESQYMQYAIGGLLAKMPEDMDIFAPYDNCYERLKGEKNAPSTISWGGNNRTVALRLPSTTLQEHNRRIEHRVSASDADPYLVMSAILKGVSYGLLNKILPASPKMYGDANLEMYGLPRLF